MGNFLNKWQRQELLDQLKSEKRLLYGDRIKVILLLDEGQTGVRSNQSPS